MSSTKQTKCTTTAKTNKVINTKVETTTLKKTKRAIKNTTTVKKTKKTIKNTATRKAFKRSATFVKN